MFNVTQFAGAKIFAKRRSLVPYKSDVDEMLREMRTADTAIARNRTDCVQRIIHSEFRQSVGDHLRTLLSGMLLSLDSTSEYVVRCIDIEAKDVNSTALPGCRQLDACD